MDVDDTIAEIQRERRHRNVLIVATLIGIVASVVCGLGFALGAFGSWSHGAAGMRNPAALVFFAGPFAVCWVIGRAIYYVLAWRARRGSQ